MLPSWHTWALRAPISTSATGRRRERAEHVVEGPGRRRAVPHFPIDAFRRLLRRQVARPGRGADTHAHRPHPPDAAAPYVLDGLAELAVELGALLAAGLEDDVVVA